jgi:hypothetical protein
MTATGIAHTTKLARQLPPTAGQHERNREQHGEHLAGEQSVRIDRGAEADALGHPLSNGPRHNRLHDRNARRT